MKKLLAILSLAIAASASATTLGFEYSDHATPNASSPREGFVINYAAVPTKYGTFDVGATALDIQGVAGSQFGYELGYSRDYKYGNYDLTPRLAYGSYEAFDGTTRAQTPYIRLSLEARRPITKVSDRLGAYSSYVYMKGTESNSMMYISNRIQLGLDFTVTKSIATRLGFSRQFYDTAVMNGFVFGASYSF